jgi:hypothetical protein
MVYLSEHNMAAIKVYDCMIKRKTSSFETDLFAYACKKDKDQVHCAIWETLDYIESYDGFTYCDVLLCPEANTLLITSFVHLEFGEFYDQECVYDLNCRDGKAAFRESLPQWSEQTDHTEQIVKNIAAHLGNMYPEYTTVQLFTPEIFQKTKQTVVDDLLKKLGYVSKLASENISANIAKFMKPSWFDYTWAESNSFSADYYECVDQMHDIIGNDLWEKESSSFARCKVLF